MSKAEEEESDRGRQSTKEKKSKAIRGATSLWEALVVTKLPTIGQAAGLRQGLTMTWRQLQRKLRIAEKKKRHKVLQMSYMARHMQLLGLLVGK